MSQIVQELIDSGHSLDEIVSGTPLDWTKVPTGNKFLVSTILIHCCVNGPVSPNKRTTYPVIGEQCLNSLVGDQKISNRGLEKTCESVAKELEARKFTKGYQFELGNFWPLR